MKKLLLIRHAKSSWDNPELSDFDRPLNKRGERDAPNTAKRLKEKKVFPDIVLSSPAARALATCEAFCKILSFNTERVIQNKNLYHADEDMLFDVLKSVKDLNDQEEVVLLFGHNPGLTEFANSLLNEDIENIPTCGVVCCDVNIESWKEIKPGCGELEYFDYPKRKKD